MVEEAIDDMADVWRNCVVPLYVDNTAVLHCIAKGRSSNKHINDMVRRILFTCATHDIVLVVRYVPSLANVLADALSHMHIQAYKAALTWFRWPDDGAPLTAAPKLTLPTAIQDDVDHYKNKAYAQTSKGTRDSAWAAWTQYCNDGQSIDPMAVLSDSDFDLLMAGFKARLARGYYGRGKAKALPISTPTKSCYNIYKT